MILLHLGFTQSHYYLWAEVPTTDEQQKHSGKSAQPYPFAGDWKHMPKADVLGFKTLRKRYKESVLWAPSRGGYPIASSPLISPEPAGKAAVKILPWLVPTIELEHEEVTTLLIQAEGKHQLKPGVVVAPDLAFATRILRLAGSMVTSQHYLPGLRDEDEGWYARWLPILSGEYQTHFRKLAAKMPASMRALREEGEAEPTEPATGVATAMLGAFLDKMVRGESPTETARRFESIHDHWLHALQTRDGRIDAPAATVAELARQAQQWRRPMEFAANAPVRLCFRLEEPQDSEESIGESEQTEQEEPDLNSQWYVRYLLQPHEDPSLLISAEDVWSGKRIPKLNQTGPRLRECMLSLLGQAAGVSTAVSQSLEEKAPEGYNLDNERALAFLSQQASLLKQFGFAVLLPAWWTDRDARTRLSVKAKAKSKSTTTFQAKAGLNLETVLQFQASLALDGVPLTHAELEQLANMKTGLVKLRGKWTEIGSDQIRAALEFLHNKRERELTVGELVRLKIGATQMAGDLPLDQIEADGWLGDMLNQLDGHREWEPCPQPKTFIGSLRPYQERGFSWMAFLGQWGLGACLADDMGLGKTVQTLALLERDRLAGQTAPVLLVCPVSVMNNWQKEAEKFTPSLKLLIHHGSKRHKAAGLRKAIPTVSLVITSYGLMQRDSRSLTTIPWRGVILDEAQHIKNSSTKLAQSARALRAQYRVALTGTPVENNVGDLWSLMEFLNPGLLGGRAEFGKRFFKPIQSKQDEGAAMLLKQITGPFILRRLKTDKTIISDLPEKMECKTYCPLTLEQTTLYAAALKKAEEKIEDSEGIARKGLVLALLTELKQICNHPAQYLADGSSHEGRSGKLLRLEEILEEILEQGERALLFSQYTKMGAILKERLQERFGVEVPFLHGSVAKKKRDAMVARFQTGQSREQPILILSLKAGGTGLNLTAANHVVHFDRWWNPAVENQASDRVFRIGQRRNVTVHKFVCAGTVEDKIDEMIEHKKQVAGSVVTTGEAWLTELTNQELKDVFALTATAMEA